MGFLKRVESGTLYYLLGKIWTAFASLATILFIVNFFDSDTQGYYYTFGSVLALQVFAELGMGVVILNHVSHECSKLITSSSPRFRLYGDKEAMEGVASLISIGIKWYFIAGFVSFIGFLVFGWLFFPVDDLAFENYWYAWVALVFTTSCNIAVQSLWVVLEGCNQVKEIYRFKFIQSVVVQFGAWVSIVNGFGVWAIFVTSLITLLTSISYLYIKYSRFFLAMLQLNKGRISWVKNLLPMQSRITISWLSGYVSFSLFVPVLYKYHGPVIAGQMGMTWVLLTSVGSISNAWLGPKVPRMAMLIANRDLPKLNTLFKSVVRDVVFASILLAAFILCVVYYISVTNNEILNQYSHRIFAPYIVAIFMVGQVLQVISMPFSAYMRACKREPIALLSVIAAVIIGAGTLTFGKYYSGLGVGATYMIAHIIVIPLLFFVWVKNRVT